MRVTILFTPEVRNNIRSACCARKLPLDDDFDTKGQVFENVFELDTESSMGNMIKISVPSLVDKDTTCDYFYRVQDISRIKVEYPID